MRGPDQIDPAMLDIAILDPKGRLISVAFDLNVSLH